MANNEIYHSEILNCTYVGEMAEVCREYERALEEYVESLDYSDPMMTLRIQAKESYFERKLKEEALKRYNQENELYMEVFNDGQHSHPNA